MLASTRAGELPRLLEPLPELLLGNLAQLTLLSCRLAITARFPLHEDELQVVLNDCIGFVRFTEEPAARVGLEHRIRNLQPNYRVEVVETDFAAGHGDVGVQ